MNGWLWAALLWPFVAVGVGLFVGAFIKRGRGPK